jgi:quercetin dioxygenase-like cupin family protein
VADTKYAPVGTRVIFENDRVRVWEIELAPGETLPMHFHELDYVVVALAHGTTTVEWADGRRETNRHTPGEIMWRTSPHAHALTNEGTQPYFNRLIELKED